MLDINKALKNANLYSIEYCGFFILKFSISNELSFYKKFQDVSLEFISGCCILDLDGNIYLSSEKIFDFYGLNIISAKLISNNQLELEFENRYKIISLDVDNGLQDRNWVIESTNDKNNYIMSDSVDLFYSDNMKEILTD